MKSDLEAVISHKIVVGIGQLPEVGPAPLQVGEVVVLPLDAGIHGALKGLEVNDLLVYLSKRVLAFNVIDRSHQGFDVIGQLLNLSKENLDTLSLLYSN